MAAVTEKCGFHFPFGIRHLLTLPASSRSVYVTPVALGAEEGSFGHHAPSTPAQATRPAREERQSSQTLAWGLSGTFKLSLHTCAYTRAYMTRPSYFRDKID